jgi:hypothetical protein
VTAVPLRSLNVTPTMPAVLHAFRHELRKPSAVHGIPFLFTSMMVLHFVVLSSVAFKGEPTGIATREPVFDCLNLKPHGVGHGHLKRRYERNCISIQPKLMGRLLTDGGLSFDDGPGSYCKRRLPKGVSCTLEPA